MCLPPYCLSFICPIILGLLIVWLKACTHYILVSEMIKYFYLFYLLSVYPSISLSFFLSLVYLSVCLSVCPSIYLYQCLSLHLFHSLSLLFNEYLLVWTLIYRGRFSREITRPLTANFTWISKTLFFFPFVIRFRWKGQIKAGKLKIKVP